MKAVLFNEFGGPEVLSYTEVPDAAAPEGGILIRAKAISVNPVDWKIRSGEAAKRIGVYPPAILGRDVAGEVVAVHPGATGASVGDKVMALGRATYAELVPLNPNEYCAIPDGMDFETAASLPLVVLTGTQLIEEAINVQSGWKVVVSGAVGSVGRAAIHAARKRGAYVVAAVRHDQMDKASQLNADEVVTTDGSTPTLDLLRDMDAVADTVSGNLATQLLMTLKPGGVYGSVLGDPPSPYDFVEVKTVAMMSHPDAKRLFELAQDVAAGEFEIPIGFRYMLSQAGEAQAAGETHKVSGKILLLP